MYNETKAGGGRKIVFTIIAIFIVAIIVIAITAVIKKASEVNSTLETDQSTENLIPNIKK